MRWLLAAASGLLLTACGSVEFSPPERDTGIGQYEVVLDRPFDDVWDQLVAYSSETFFAIDNVQRDSGLLTLAFGVEDLEQVVDCGTAVWNGETVSTIDYFLEPVPGYNDETDFIGRMNILVQEVSSQETRVRVSARYDLTYTSFTGGFRSTWAFSTGEDDTEILVDRSITCQPTYFAERSVLVEGLGAQI